MKNDGILAEILVVCVSQERNIVAHVCGDPLSRYTCRATRVATEFILCLGFFGCSRGIALHPP